MVLTLVGPVGAASPAHVLCTDSSQIWAPLGTARPPPPRPTSHNPNPTCPCLLRFSNYTVAVESKLLWNHVCISLPTLKKVYRILVLVHLYCQLPYMILSSLSFFIFISSAVLSTACGSARASMPLHLLPPLPGVPDICLASSFTSLRAQLKYTLSVPKILLPHCIL